MAPATPLVTSVSKHRLHRDLLLDCTDIWKPEVLFPSLTKIKCTTSQETPVTAVCPFGLGAGCVATCKRET